MCVRPQGGGGTPARSGGVTPSPRPDLAARGGGRVRGTPARSGGGTPYPQGQKGGRGYPSQGSDSGASTGHTAVGMSLVFRQEDFLIL